MIELYKKIDAKLLKKYPKLWILGIHFYVPIIIALYLILYGIGFAYSMDPLPKASDTRDFMSSILTFMIIPLILLSILFIIRQIKFNSMRVHHSLPYRNVILNFLSFLIISSAIFFLPFVVQLGTYHKAKLAINEEEFLEDARALHVGYSHFYNADVERHVRVLANAENAVYDDEALLDESGNIYKSWYMRTYRMDESNQNLILFRGSLIDYRVRGERNRLNKTTLSEFVSTNYWDTIPIKQAEDEITAFLAVSEKYEGVSAYTSPRSLIEAQIEHCKEELKKKNEYDQKAFIALKNDSRFSDVLEFHEDVIIRDSMFFALAGKFLYVFIGFPLYFSLILLVICSVRIVDFGWGMLAIALSVTLYSTIMGFFALTNGSGNSEVFAFVLLMIFVLLTAIFSFGKFGIKPGLRKALGIMFQLMLPIVVMIVFFFMDEFHECPLPYDECIGFEYFERDIYYKMAYLTSIVSGLISVFVFNKYYEMRYVHPKD